MYCCSGEYCISLNYSMSHSGLRGASHYLEADYMAQRCIIWLRGTCHASKEIWLVIARCMLPNSTIVAIWLVTVKTSQMHCTKLLSHCHLAGHRQMHAT